MLTDAYAVCERLARSHYENFPVASRLLPRSMRPHIAAIYAFARIADDFADEGTLSVSERHRLLDAWLARLRACTNGGTLEIDRHDTDEAVHVFTALGATMNACNLPLGLFEDLLSAFRQDVTTTRYETWTDVLDYCRRSANPVGRLVLRVAGYHDAQLDNWSDRICTALQLTNFWQDFEIDWRRGRLYLPREEYVEYGADEADLERRHFSAAWQRAMINAAARTRDLFLGGRPLCDRVTGRLRLELRFTWLGGMTVLEKLERAGFDVFRSRPSLGAADLPGLAMRALAWSTSD